MNTTENPGNGKKPGKNTTKSSLSFFRVCKEELRLTLLDPRRRERFGHETQPTWKGEGIPTGSMRGHGRGQKERGRWETEFPHR